jgi:hypothetical protein
MEWERAKMMAVCGLKVRKSAALALLVRMQDVAYHHD